MSIESINRIIFQTENRTLNSEAFSSGNLRLKRYDRREFPASVFAGWTRMLFSYSLSFKYLLELLNVKLQNIKPQNVKVAENLCLSFTSAGRRGLSVRGKIFTFCGSAVLRFTFNTCSERQNQSTVNLSRLSSSIVLNTILQKIILFLCCNLIALSCLAQNNFPFQLASPLIKSDKVLFMDTTFVEIELAMEGVNIYYTLDGSEPDETTQFYTKPIVLTKNTVLKAIAFHQECQPSDISQKHFFKAQKINMTEAALIPMPHKNYPGDGVSSLTDHQKGSLDFRDGLWLGIAKEDVEIEYTLLDTMELNSITLSTISDPKSWIFPPTGMEVWITDEQNELLKVGTLEIDTLKEMEKPNLQFHTCTFVKCKTTKLKVIIKNTNTIPEWHLRAGKGAWLFMDELIFE